MTRESNPMADATEQDLMRELEDFPYPVAAIHSDGTIGTHNAAFGSLLGGFAPHVGIRELFDCDDAALEQALNDLRNGRSYSERLLVRGRHAPRQPHRAVLWKPGRPVDPFLCMLFPDDVPNVQQPTSLTMQQVGDLLWATDEYALFFLDPAGIIVDCNAGAERMFGCPRDHIIGRPIEHIYTVEDNLQGRSFVERSLAARAGAADDDRWHRGDRSQRFWAEGKVLAYRRNGRLLGYLKLIRDATDRRNAEEKHRFLAWHDPLTGLANRAYLSEQLHRAMRLAQRRERKLAVHLIDLDLFKNVNDTFGHSWGDRVLTEVAQRCLFTMRETDVVARVGGDEFVVVQQDPETAADAKTLAAKLLDAIRQPLAVGDSSVVLGATIGTAVFPDDGADEDTLLSAADMALYHCKRRGRNQAGLFQEIQVEVGRRLSSEDLNRAMDENQLALHFQPAVDLASWQVVGVEAYLRWPAMETVADVETLLGLADSAGTTQALSSWVVRSAFAFQKLLAERGLAWPLFINVGRSQLLDRQFAEAVTSLCASEQVEPRQLILEVNETTLESAPPTAVDNLNALREAGIRLCVDRFGSGLAGLNLLLRFPVDVVKVDRAIVHGLPRGTYETQILDALCRFTRDRQIETIACGVESAEQLVVLERSGCLGAQGFLIMPPQDEDHFLQTVFRGEIPRVNPTLG